MSQEQLKEQFLQFTEYNLTNDTILGAIKELLDSIINDICYEYIPESNKLTTASLIIKGVLESENNHNSSSN